MASRGVLPLPVRGIQKGQVHVSSPSRSDHINSRCKLPRGVLAGSLATLAALAPCSARNREGRWRRQATARRRASFTADDVVVVYDRNSKQAGEVVVAIEEDSAMAPRPVAYAIVPSSDSSALVELARQRQLSDGCMERLQRDASACAVLPGGAMIEDQNMQLAVIWKLGHRKRLLRAHEESLDSLEGLQGGPGRSTVKRSLHNGSRRRFDDPAFVGKYGSDYKIHTRRNLLRKHMVADLMDMYDEIVADEEWSEDEWVEGDWLEDDDTLSESSFYTCGTASTAASTCDQSRSLETSTKTAKTSNRWDEAIGRASMIAKKYTRPTKSSVVSEPTKKQNAPHKATTLTEVLRAKHNIKLVSPGSSDSQHDSLQRFQMDFLERFLPSISSGLRGVFRNEIVLRAASTSKPVYDRFCRSQTQKQGNLCAVFHGTDQANLPSIYEKGLLVPGGGKGVSVRNGASHGNGIYTAKTHNPALSFGFCRGETRPMLVCGVLDDAVALARPYKLGNHTVTAESQHVRHVGDAIVVFDESRVVPLFEAWEPGLCANYAPIVPPARSPIIPAVVAQLRPAVPIMPTKSYKGGPKTRLPRSRGSQERG
ncbi:unnamed protein product [Symbiodinium natans]|uniref:PARP catalytic domain-containing protein n=1 Tax=Symbiodinium natans TaxID=878477 RepID=A0A812H6J4_9DINO|nr:unnamed protein product [Symbiodinium natans]